MRLSKVATAIAASLSLIGSPVLAQTSAPSAPVAASARAGESVEGASEFSSEWIVPGFILLGVVVILATILFDDGDGDSDSP